MKSKYATIVLLVLILALQIALRIPFLGEPLERDEGSYAYIAQRMLVGEIPYRDYFDHKPPVIYFAYAGIFKLFGDSMLSIRLFTLFFSLILTLLVFAVGYLWWGRSGGILSAFLYALFSGGPLVQGTSANTETFMVLPLLLALYFFLLGKRREDQGKAGNIREGLFFLAGLFSGLAVMTKQVALINFLVLLGFVSFEAVRPHNELWGIKKILKALWLISGFLVPPLFFVVYFWWKGALPDFIEAAFLYNLAYAKYKLWNWPALVNVVRNENLVLWFLSALAVFLIFFRERRNGSILLACWGLASLTGVFLGKSFYGHYFIQVMPALALLSAFALLMFFEWKKRYIPALGIGLLICVMVSANLSHWIDYLSLSPEEISIRKYATWDFVIAPEVAEFIRLNTLSSDSIFVWGAEQELYFYSQRKAASKYFYFYPLMYPGEKAVRYRRHMLEDVKKSRPKYIVVSSPGVQYKPFFDMLKSGYTKIGTSMNWEIWEHKGIR